MGCPPEACGMSGTCSCQFVVEADGGVYPCDFYVIDEWYLGSINEMGFEELKFSDAGKRFVEISRHVDPKCSKCKWYNICLGGCAGQGNPLFDGLPALNRLCNFGIPSFSNMASLKGFTVLAQMFRNNM